MAIRIFSRTPARVWALVAALVLSLGMLALSLSGVFGTFGHVPMALGGGAPGLGAAIDFGRRFGWACGAFSAICLARWFSRRQAIRRPAYAPVA